ncbi:MAG: LptF/LptG family permease [Holosporaceae bacterium]|nr:LptF/LptG family permease [Holosporaceae bacterium]
MFSVIFFRMLRTTFYSTVALAFCAWVVQSSRYMEILSVNSVSLAKFLEFTSYLSVDIILVILPISFAMSSAFIFHRFNESNQLVAFKAAGITPLKLLIPLMQMACILMIGIYFGNMYVSPVAWTNFRSMEFGIKNNIDAPEKAGLIFSGSGFHVYAQQYKGNFLFGNIFVIDRRCTEKTHCYYAKSGTVKNNMLLLMDGEQIEVDQIGHRHSIIKFESYQHNLQNILSTVKKTSQANEKFMNELLQDTNDDIQNKLQRALFHQKMMSPSLTLIFALLSFLLLLLSPYRRKPSYIRMLTLTFAIIFVQGTFFWMANAAAKNPIFIAFNYTFIVFLILVPLILSIFYIRRV